MMVCLLGWCEFELLLKSQNPQADYGSMIIPEQVLSKVFGHKMYQFLQNWPQRISIFTLKKCRENYKITKMLIMSEPKVLLI